MGLSLIPYVQQQVRGSSSPEKGGTGWKNLGEVILFTLVAGVVIQWP